MNAVDLLANVEREPEHRPRPIAPLLPDVDSPDALPCGAVMLEIRRWRLRALAAEAELLALRHAMGFWRHTT
jgi:hypothetical protein